MQRYTNTAMGLLDRLNPRKTEKPRSFDDDDDLWQTRGGSPDGVGDDPRRRPVPQQTPRRSKSSSRRPARPNQTDSQDDDRRRGSFQSMNPRPNSGMPRRGSDNGRYPQSYQRRGRSTDRYNPSPSANPPTPTAPPPSLIDSRNGQGRNSHHGDDKLPPPSPSNPRFPSRPRVGDSKMKNNTNPSNESINSNNISSNNNNINGNDKGSRSVASKQKTPSQHDREKPMIRQAQLRSPTNGLNGVDGGDKPTRPPLLRRKSGDGTENSPRPPPRRKSAGGDQQPLQQQQQQQQQLQQQQQQQQQQQSNEIGGPPRRGGMPRPGPNDSYRSDNGRMDRKGPESTPPPRRNRGRSVERRSSKNSDRGPLSLVRSLISDTISPLEEAAESLFGPTRRSKSKGPNTNLPPPIPPTQPPPQPSQLQQQQQQQQQHLPQTTQPPQPPPPRRRLNSRSSDGYDGPPPSRGRDTRPRSPVNVAGVAPPPSAAHHRHRNDSDFRADSDVHRPRYTQHPQDPNPNPPNPSQPPQPTSSPTDNIRPPGEPVNSPKPIDRKRDEDHRSTDNGNTSPTPLGLSSHDRIILQGQKSREKTAERQGQFIENQRVRYYHKARDTWYDDVKIVAVHHDDGPDKPYYTVKYENGDGKVMEKQTMPDRLEYVEWDDSKSSEILNLSSAKSTIPSKNDSYDQNVLDAQRAREQAAERQGLFTEKQRARYYNKTGNMWHEDVQIMGVHHDDGPDKPYYTVKFTMPNGEVIEKQTTSGRLEYVEWDPEKTWAILNET